MPLSYVAVFCLALLGVIIGHRRPASRGMQTVCALMFVIALFSLALVVAYTGVIVAAWAGQF